MATARPSSSRTPGSPGSPGAPGVSLAGKLGATMLAVALVPLLLAIVLADRLLGGPLIARHEKILSDLAERVAGQAGQTIGEEVQGLAQLAAAPEVAAAAAGAAPAAAADRALAAFRVRSPQHLALQLIDRS